MWLSLTLRNLENATVAITKNTDYINIFYRKNHIFYVTREINL